MKRALACVAAVALLAGTASALSVGPGMKVYSSNGTKGGSPSVWQSVALYRTTVGSNWTATEVDNNFQTITVPSTTYDTNYGDVSRVEVWDPRRQSGQGNLALLLPGLGQIYASGESSSLGLVKIDVKTPSNNSSFSLGTNILVNQDAKDRYTAGSTSAAMQAVKTPANWGGKTTNNVGVYISRDGYAGTYRYDAGGNGVADNISTEFSTAPARPTGYSLYAGDLEAGLDGAIYQSWSSAAGSTGIIQRITNTSGTMAGTTFFKTGGAGNIVGMTEKDGTMLGIAAGGTASKSILYVAALDNTLVAGVPTYTMSIFALSDGDGDGVVTPGNAADTIAQVWRNGNNGLTITSFNQYIYDAEYYKDDNGVQWVLFNTYNTGGRDLYALQLADNGLVATGVKLVASKAVTGFYFEIDANPAAGAVPEPTTLALIGTGALGALGWMRRRKLK